MPNNVERGRQFLPFDALKGFREMLRTVERKKENKVLFTEDLEQELNNKIKYLVKGMNVKIEYYYGIEYIETSGIIKKIDSNAKIIYLLNSKISFDDILNIEIAEIKS